jgi:hypothetical protein
VLTEENFKFSPQKLRLFYTVCRETSKTESKQEAQWQTTPRANLVRNTASGNYYARVRLKGKLIWKSLKTDRLAVAKLRVGDYLKRGRPSSRNHSGGRAWQNDIWRCGCLVQATPRQRAAPETAREGVSAKHD